jgi:hypothetical protein
MCLWKPYQLLVILHKLESKQIRRYDFEAKSTQIDGRAKVKILTLVSDGAVTCKLFLSRQIKFSFAKELASNEAEVTARKFKDGNCIFGQVVADFEKSIVVLAYV